MIPWQNICLPAIDADGEALWPERYDVAALEEIRRDIGEYDWASLFQQHPVARHGRVYSVFSRTTHVRPHAELEKLYCSAGKWLFRRVVISVDFGWTHPGVMLVLGQTGTGDWIAIHEEVHERLLFALLHTDGTPGWLSIATRLRDTYLPWTFVADPSEPGNITALRNELGGRPVVQNANNDMAEGIRLVNVALTPEAPEPGAPRKWPKLTISSACKHLIGEFESWCYLTAPDGTPSDTPSDTGDDALDALRYALATVN